MNTSFLKNFITVAEEQSISAAARKAHIAQSALSLQLKALEDDTGCTLLVRSRKGVCLTDRGELFYRYAKRILGLETEMKDRLYENARSGGILRLGVSSSCLSSVLENQLHSFGRRFPAVRYELYERSGNEVLEALRSGIIDVGIISSSAVPGSDIRVRYKNREPMAVLYNGRYSLPDTAVFPDLRELPVCITRRSLSIWRHLCAMHGFETHIAACCEQYETAANLAVRGRGAAIIPHAMALRYASYAVEDKRSYFDASRMRIYTSDGKRIFPELCDACSATGHRGNVSVVLRGGFDGWLLCPLETGATLPISRQGDARVGLSSLADLTSLILDFRLDGARKGQQYAVGGFCLTDNLPDTPPLEDFSDGINGYRPEDMSLYGQLLPDVSIRPFADTPRALTVTVPQNGQYVDNIHIRADWVKNKLIPAIGQSRYLGVHIINPSLPSLAVSIGAIEAHRMHTAMLNENIMDTSFMVLSCADRIASPVAEEFIREFLSHP